MVLIQQLREECSASTGSLDELFRMGLLRNDEDRVSISTAGQKCTLLLKAVNGAADLPDTFNRLTVLFPQVQQYYLIEGNVTDYVVDTLNARRDFIRLYICSPWIRLREPYFSRLSSAVEACRIAYPQLQIFVITLPLDRYNDAHAVLTLRNLQALGATVMTHRKLHAKLYVSQPGPLGGSQYAVVGSENLTGANQIELAIKIENENEMLGRLVQFFLEIEAESTLLQELK
jgi:hypothetical protein